MGRRQASLQASADGAAPEARYSRDAVDEAPAVADGGSTSALEALAHAGPGDGRWSYRDPRRALDQVVARDVIEPSVVHVRAAAASTGRAKSLPMDVLARILLGNVERFLANYKPCEAATPDEVDGRRLVRVRWCSSRDESGPTRSLWLDPTTRVISRFEDRTADGHLIRTLSFTPISASEFVPPAPGAADRVRAAMPALSSRTIRRFEDFVSRVDIPIYEPAELPPGYARTEYGFDNRQFGKDGPTLRVAWIGYDEGVTQMNLFIAPPEDMGRLETMSRQAAVTPPGAGVSATGRSASAAASGATSDVPAVPAVPVSGCASMPVDTPEELVEDAGAVTVRFRSDGCRIVVRRDDLPGVSIAIVGSAATSREAYIRTIRNLVLVPARPK